MCPSTISVEVPPEGHPGGRPVAHKPCCRGHPATANVPTRNSAAPQEPTPGRALNYQPHCRAPLGGRVPIHPTAQGATSWPPGLQLRGWSPAGPPHPLPAISPAPQSPAGTALIPDLSPAQPLTAPTPILSGSGGTSLRPFLHSQPPQGPVIFSSMLGTLEKLNFLTLV